MPFTSPSVSYLILITFHESSTSIVMRIDSPWHLIRRSDFTIIDDYEIFFVRARTTIRVVTRQSVTGCEGKNKNKILPSRRAHYVGRVPPNLSALKSITTHRADRPINRDIHARTLSWCAPPGPMCLYPCDVEKKKLLQIDRIRSGRIEISNLTNSKCWFSLPTCGWNPRVSRTTDSRFIREIKENLSKKKIISESIYQSDKSSLKNENNGIF